MNEPKKLYRTEHGAAMLAGVCGGVSEYFNLDPSVVRLVWAALCCLWAPAWSSTWWPLWSCPKRARFTPATESPARASVPYGRAGRHF